MIKSLRVPAAHGIAPDCRNSIFDLLANAGEGDFVDCSLSTSYETCVNDGRSEKLFLGKEFNGLRPVSIDDGSWTGLWPGYLGTIEVTFDERDRVRESPSYARRVLDWLGP